MHNNTRLALVALAILGVYLFGVMTGAVGLPLARTIGGAVFAMHTGSPGGYPGGMMDDSYGPRGGMRAPGIEQGWDRDGCPMGSRGTEAPRDFVR